MVLNGKCKEAFENWLHQEEEFITISDVLELAVDVRHIDRFNEFPKSMRFGVYVDFFDSVGVYINKLCPDSFEIIHGFDLYEDYSQVDRTRQEARTKAIEKASEIFNNQN